MSDQNDDRRLEQQLDFVREVDKLKQIERQTWLLDGSRRENDAEHSWHLALMAIVLREYADGQDLDLLRVIEMVVIHDLVEIDAGDTYAYDPEANADKADREQRAAERIFGLLPDDQAERLRALWEEFEQRTTPEARFAASLDRFQPVMHNFHTAGRAWREHGIRIEQVLARNRPMAEGAPRLWQHTHALLDEAIRRGYLRE